MPSPLSPMLSPINGILINILWSLSAVLTGIHNEHLHYIWCSQQDPGEKCLTGRIVRKRMGSCRVLSTVMRNNHVVFGLGDLSGELGDSEEVIGKSHSSWNIKFSPKGRDEKSSTGMCCTCLLLTCLKRVWECFGLIQGVKESLVWIWRYGR